MNRGDFGVLILEAGWRQLEASFDLAEADALTVAHAGLAFDADIVHPGTISRSAVANDDLSSVQEDFAMILGNGVMLDDKGVAESAADGGLAFRDFERLVFKKRRRENEFSHK